MRSTPRSLGVGPAPSRRAHRRPGVRRGEAHTDAGDTVLNRVGVAVLLKLLMIAGVVLVALPALWLGIGSVGRRSGYSSADPADRASLVVLVVLRVLTLLLVFLLSAVVLVSAI